MSNSAASVPHLSRTQADRRSRTLHNATVGEVRQINASIRRIRLDLDPKEELPLSHLPGQYLDVHIPGLANAGGFTITSPPSTTTHSQPHLTLAIQSSPSNPAAEYFFAPDPSTNLLGARLQIRVGGSFVYPPLHLGHGRMKELRRRVFIAAGVGVNPIMSMVAHIAESELSTDQGRGLEDGDNVEAHEKRVEEEKEASAPDTGMKGVKVLYSTRVLYASTQVGGTNKAGKSPAEDHNVEEILFAQELRQIATKAAKENVPETQRMALSFFRTDPSMTSSTLRKDRVLSNVKTYGRRMTREDILEAVGQTAEERHTALVYVCGPPDMTDDLVGWLEELEGFKEEDVKRVLCEKWW